MAEISTMKTLESVENFTTPSGNVCDLGHGYSYTSAGKKIFPKKQHQCEIKLTKPPCPSSPN